MKITTHDDGPYTVEGTVPLRRKGEIRSAEGEPLAWRVDDADASQDSYALCRCGGSSDKPYCDGTHSAIEFDGTCSTPDADYASRSDELGGTGLTVHDDRSICEHAGFCGNRASNVWKMVDKTDDVQVRTAVIGMVEKCPSGALTYEMDGQTVEPEYATEIGVVDDGPLWVTGGIPVETPDGELLETRNRVTLCRCGASGNKPLCDGSHAKAGFSDSA